jgi:hypothetical protein
MPVQKRQGECVGKRECHCFSQFVVFFTAAELRVMEANKGTAEQCLDVARGHLRKGNFALAKKMLEKSKKLYPLPGVDALLARAESSAASADSDAARMRAKKTAASSQRANPTEAAAPTRPYTKDQADLVNRIKRLKKDHYRVLGTQFKSISIRIIASSHFGFVDLSCV